MGDTVVFMGTSLVPGRLAHIGAESSASVVLDHPLGGPIGVIVDRGGDRPVSYANSTRPTRSRTASFDSSRPMWVFTVPSAR